MTVEFRIWLRVDFRSILSGDRTFQTKCIVVLS